ncbi:hypothetical protein MHU86_2600 [Fragilaria crotonensis]|nr:hypothetical protein MHU86_2600 [Fragilaria crotonensis]
MKSKYREKNTKQIGKGSGDDSCRNSSASTGSDNRKINTRNTQVGRQGNQDDSYYISSTSTIASDNENQIKSPTASPTKKKPRRQNSGELTGCSIIDTTTEGDDDESADGESELAAPQRLFVSYRTDNDELVQGHRSRLSSNYDQGKEKSSPDSRSQVLSSTMATQSQLTTCITPTSNNHDNFESKKDLYTAVLEEKNARLHERVIELDRSHVNLVVQVEALTAEITRLKVHGDDVQEQGHVIATEESQMCDENNTSAKSRKHRIQVENTKFSRELSILINDFVTSSCFADKRRFPISRLAKIVVDSILSFQWTHSEVAKFSSHCNAADAWSTLSELLNVRNMKRCRDKSKAAILVDCMWDDNFLDGEVQRCMVEKVRCHLRTHVFSPWKILKAMDVSGFKLSLAGIEVLRRVDMTSKYGRGILPSKSTILRAARMLEAEAERFCPFSMIGQTFQGVDKNNLNDGNDIGEGFEFDAIKVTKTLFEAFGLMEVAKRRAVDLALTSDGAQLTNTISHVAAGLKFNDMAICDPFTKRPLLLHEPDSLVQSRNLCFPLRIVIAKDTKKTLDGFRALYNKFNNGEVARALLCQSFKMSFPGDMKLQWGALDDGGAAKVKDKFCYICPCRSSSLHVPQDKTRCSICREKPIQVDNECYHYPFVADPEVRGELEDELRVLTELVHDILIDADGGDNNEQVNETNPRQKMYVRRSGDIRIEGDTFDIDFKASQQSDKAIWARHITDELASRSMPVTGTLYDRQQRLRQQLVNEQRTRDITRMLADSEPKDQAMYLVMQAVVCILHLENRVGLKCIESILRSGLSHARKGLLDWTVAKGVSRRQDEYVHRITSTIGTQILGTAMAPSQWRFPLSEDGSMGTLSMDNNRTRSVMNSIELLVEESFPNSDANKHLLLRCFHRYRAAMIILRKNTDATEDEIRTFQDHIDAWFQDWVKVYGKEGCTNYTHMLSSAHVMRYMQEWKCLHRFSQQGWEALNALIKAYFFRRTNRGGLARNTARKSKLLGIARWLQRRMMWFSGHGDALFIKCDDDNEDETSSFEDNDEEGNDNDDTSTDSEYDSNDIDDDDD